MRLNVIKPDGTVPFGEGLSDENRKLLIGDLVDDGHVVQHVNAPHPLYGGVSHAILLSGPHCKAEQDKRRAAEAAAAPKP